MRWFTPVVSLVLVAALPPAGARAGESYESWPLLRSTFPSTGGGGFMIKGYDPVFTGGKCITTFMAVEPGAEPKGFSASNHCASSVTALFYRGGARRGRARR